jgi:hypothetical protein
LLKLAHRSIGQSFADSIHKEHTMAAKLKPAPITAKPTAKVPSKAKTAPTPTARKAAIKPGRKSAR